MDGTTRPVRAVEVEGERRGRIWEQALLVYPGWAQYERRASHRRIAIFVLEPASDDVRPASPEADEAGSPSARGG